jgi:hypothetical protein
VVRPKEEEIGGFFEASPGLQSGGLTRVRDHLTLVSTSSPNFIYDVVKMVIIHKKI